MNPEQEQARDQALEHVGEGRRGFLRKLLAAGTAVAAVPLMTEVALAQPPAGKGKGGKGKGSMPNPAELAKKLLAEFDKDGDKALSEKELTAALEAMQKPGVEGKGGAKGKGGGKGGAKGKGGGAGGKGKGNV